MRGLFFLMTEGAGQRERDDCSASWSLRARHHLKEAGLLPKERQEGRRYLFSYPFMLLLFIYLYSITQNGDRSRVTVIKIDSKRYGGEAQYQELVDLFTTTSHQIFAMPSTGVA